MRILQYTKDIIIREVYIMKHDKAKIYVTDYTTMSGNPLDTHIDTSNDSYLKPDIIKEVSKAITRRKKRIAKEKKTIDQSKDLCKAKVSITKPTKAK